MDDLIIRSLQGRTTEKEEELLRRWLEGSPEDASRYRAFARIWSLMGDVAPAVDPGPSPTAEALLEQAEAENSVEPAPRQIRPVVRPSGRRSAFGLGGIWGRKRLRHAMVGALAAAVVAVGIGIGVLLSGSMRPSPFAGSEIVTGAGELTTLMLADGSSMRVGPQSRIRLTRESGEMVADLEGRAFFAVSRDRSRRFRVRTDHGDARVLGTRFEVRSETDEFRVLVVQGEVRVSAGEEDIALREGHMSESSAGGPPNASRVDDVYEQLTWMGNALIFQATPLRAVAEEIERRYSVSLVIDDEYLAEQTVTATFTDQELDYVLLVICESIGASCTVDGSRVRIGASPSLTTQRNRIN